MTLENRTVAMSAPPMGSPGCPELAACTASMERARMALAIASCLALSVIRNPGLDVESKFRCEKAVTMGCFARGRHIPDPVFESMTLALDSANHHPRQNKVWPSDTKLANSAMFEVIVTRWKRIRRTRLVTASPHEDNFSAAIERLDRALNRLDTSVRAMAGRVRSVNKLE